MKPGSEEEYYAPYDAVYAKVYEPEPLYNEDCDFELERLLEEMGYADDAD